MHTWVSITNTNNIRLYDSSKQVIVKWGSNGATSGAGTATLPEHMRSPPVFLWCSSYSICSFKCMLCRSLFFFLHFFFSQLCCLLSSIYGFWLPLYLVSSNLLICLLFFYHLIYMECGTKFTLLELSMYCSLLIDKS